MALGLQGELALRLVINVIRNRLNAGELSRADAREIIDGALWMLPKKRDRKDCAAVLKEFFPDIRIDTLEA